MATLDELGLQHGTDKSSSEHNYTWIYDRLFTPWRDQPISLLELGIWKGASLAMWDEYFTHPGAQIHGIDRAITYDSLRFSDRVCTHVCDQAEIPPGLQDATFDVIIDDASHLSSKTITSFINWWSRLKMHGFYIVEDLMTSYYADNPVEADPNPEAQVPNVYGRTAMQWFKRMADQVNAWMIPQDYSVGAYDDIAAVSFHPNMVIVTKG
jgi:8-demethyl-8-(2-methoxy-alpha-L-rhamnosyl)tetracenomycin-C 3'-O-methyltransferase